MPNTYYSTVLPGVAGGPSIQATFVDANPFIIAYNATTNKYHSGYYVNHVCLLRMLSTLMWHTFMQQSSSCGSGVSDGIS